MAPDAGATSAASSPSASLSPARFSRPIAAVEVPPGVTFVAGLVVPRGAIAVTLLGPDGATRWTREVIPGVTWSANATLSVLRSREGAVVVWRGLHGKEETTLAAAVDVDGKVQGELFAVGAAPCATDVDLAWVDHGPKGTWQVKARGPGAGGPTVALTLPEDREPVLYCGPHSVFGLGDGDDDVTLTTFRAGARSATMRVIDDADFRGDEERSHELYSVADALGIVRVGQGGTVAVREVTADHRSPWRRMGRKLTEGDDVTLVDADSHVATLAFTRDTSAAGDVTGTSSVQALAWDRAGTREASYELAAPDPSRVRGPFWSGAVTGGVVIAWAERPSRGRPGDAPIMGLTYRVVALDALGESHHVDRRADELVDAGCDDVHCYAVALVRAEGEDGGQAEAAEVLRYP